MLPLGGLFLGFELIPLFPPLRAVMLKQEGGGEQCRLMQPVNRWSGYRLRPCRLPESGLPRPQLC